MPAVRDRLPLQRHPGAGALIGGAGGLGLGLATAPPTYYQGQRSYGAPHQYQQQQPQYYPREQPPYREYPEYRGY